MEDILKSLSELQTDTKTSNEMTSRHEAEIKKKDLVIEEKDKTIQMKNQIIEEAIMAKDEAIKARDKALAAMEEAVNAKNEAINKFSQYKIDKEREIGESKGVSTESRCQLESK
jgi:uncharacterized protein (DUF3084 family)